MSLRGGFYWKRPKDFLRPLACLHLAQRIRGPHPRVLLPGHRFRREARRPLIRGSAEVPLAFSSAWAPPPGPPRVFLHRVKSCSCTGRGAASAVRLVLPVTPLQPPSRWKGLRRCDPWGSNKPP